MVNRIYSALCSLLRLQRKDSCARRSRWYLLALGIYTALLTGCEPKPVLTPLDLESPITYEKQISYLFRVKCMQCHNFGEYNWMVYEQAFKHREKIVEYTQSCRMPPGNCLTQIDKEAIKKWVEEGAR